MKFIKYYVAIIVFLLASFSFVYAINPTSQEPMSDSNELDTEPTLEIENDIILDAEKIISEATKDKKVKVLTFASNFIPEDAYSTIIDSVISGNNIGDKLTLLEYASKNETDYSEYIFEALMSDSAYAVRDFDLYTCGLIKNPVLLDEAREALADKDYYVRARAAWYLAQIEDVAYLDKIEGNIANESGWCALRFAQSASILGSQNAKSYLKSKSLDGKNVKMQAYALSMLLESGDNSAIDPLLKLTGIFDDRASSIAFEALAKYLPENSKALPYVIAKGDVSSLKISLKRILNSELAVPILNRAINLTDKKTAEFLSSIISRGKSKDFFLTALRSDDDYLKELLPEGLLLAASIDRENGLLLAREIIKTNCKNDKIINICMDIIGDYGDYSDLPILEGYFKQGGDIALISAATVLKIKNQIKK